MPCWPALLVAGSACQSPSAPAATTPAPASRAASPTSPAQPTAARPNSMQLVKPCIPAGYRVHATLAGDLNRDAWPDRVVVLDTAATLTDSTPEAVADHITWFHRPLLLRLGKPGGAQ